MEMTVTVNALTYYFVIYNGSVFKRKQQAPSQSKPKFQLNKKNVN